MSAFPAAALAQVDTEHPNEFAVSVVFPHLGLLSAVRVRVAADHATGVTGAFELPAQGTWGIVQFYQDDPRSGIWVQSIPDLRQHAAPLEILAEDPRAVVNYLPDGTQQLHFSNGDHETAFPDGSLLRLTSSDKDPASPTPRKRSVRRGVSSVRESYTPPEKAPLHIHLRRVTLKGLMNLDVDRYAEITLKLVHKDKTLRYKVNLTPDGKINVLNLKETEFTMFEDGSAELKLKVGSRLLMDTDGAAKIEFTTEAGEFRYRLSLAASGEAELTNGSGAAITVTASGEIHVLPALGRGVKVLGGGVPVAHVGSVVGIGPDGVMRVMTGNPLFTTQPL